MANRSSRGLVTKVAALFTIMFLISMIEQISAQTSAANCTGVGGQCLSGSECCSRHCTKPLGLLGSRKLIPGACFVPCIKSGKPCEVDSECCSSKCNLATDVEPIRKCLTPCVGPNLSCKDHSDCCSGNCAVTAKTGIFSDLLSMYTDTCSATSCTPLGKQCKVSSDCCSGNCSAMVGCI